MDIVCKLEKEILEIRKKLVCKEQELLEVKEKMGTAQINSKNGCDLDKRNSLKVQFGDSIPKWAIERYSRQILLPDIGVRGQENLMRGKVLIVGAGGLGCPAAVYLAGAGVGEIGIVDYDTVDITNIHRQFLHTEKEANTSKAESAANSLRSINSRIKVTAYKIQLDSSNALEIASNYDAILDCSDNVPTRYMLSDVAVIAKIPLISGSALKMEGQLTIYGYRGQGPDDEPGPCYRCVFPRPPPPEAVGSCSANGVAGPVPGAIGALQALEAIKLLVGHARDKLLVGRMLIFDGEDMSFRTVKLRPRNVQCPSCSENPTITKLVDYEIFCSAQANDKDLNLDILPPENRITVTELAGKLTGDVSEKRHLLVDVRSAPEFNMCKIDGAVNYPIDDLRKDKMDALLTEIRKCTSQVTFICRRGNDSQIAAKRVLDVIEDKHKNKIKDLTGGLHAWSKYIDHDFPVY
ncbi:adenylyltransferase and sulfurtransferase MOCS3 [Zerene cesonia]|uniref:adenylyltransferase and sulfurtransferase MOCS3 n=1 Tax=Zerene cesonia TaxID=33412 RepID=UPI0018E56AFA|nr:adenylyltransferase and sulfurtransferase MOCS3 [Zerene cesonia]